MGKTKGQRRVENATANRWKLKPEPSIKHQRADSKTEFIGPTKPTRASRPSLPVSEQKDNHKIRKKAWLQLLELVGTPSEAEYLLKEILRVYLPHLHGDLVAYQNLSSNLIEAFELFNGDIHGKDFGAPFSAAVTEGLPISKAAKITKYSPSSIREGRKKLAVRRVATCEFKPQEMDIDDRPPSTIIDTTDLFPHPGPVPMLRNVPSVIVPPIENLKKTKSGQQGKKKNSKPKAYTPNGNAYFLPKCSNVSVSKWNWFTDWLWTVAPRGHSKDPQRRLVWTTWKETYEAYKEGAKDEGHPIKSLDWVKKWATSQDVKKGIFDKYRCPTCAAGLRTIADTLNKAITPQQQKIIQEYREHVGLYKTQSQLYAAQLQHLPYGKILLVFDYGSIHETAKFKLKDLNFTAYWKDEKMELKHTFFDFWSTSAKDYNFTVKAYHTLLSLPFFKQFNEIILWSDGGLKTKEIILWFSKAAEGFRRPTQMNYFAPCGHSICDGHFGTGKRLIRKRVGVGLVADEQQVIDAFSSIANTAPGINLGPIVDKLAHAEPLPDQIRKWFQFYFTETELCIVENTEGSNGCSKQ